MNVRRMAALMLCLLCLPFCVLAEGRVVNLTLTPDAEYQLDETMPLLEVWFPPVKGADACILRMGDEVMVVDAATAGQYPRLQKLLKELGIERVNIGFNTHPHDDHIQGFEYMPQDVQLDQFLYTFPEDANNNMKNALRVMAENNIPTHRVQDGDVLKLDKAEILVIQKTESWFSDNNRSAMLLVRYGDCTLLLAADVELDGQNLLLEMMPEMLDADILKYPHHGVDIAGWNFLKHVSPEVAVVTNGKYSVKRTRKDAHKRHLPLVYTDQGAVRLMTDGQTWVLEQFPAEK